MSKARAPIALLCAASVAAIVLAGCGGRAPSAVSSTSASASAALRDESGSDVRVSELASRAALTVLVFFDSECPVQKAHDARVRGLVATYGPRGVSFFGVVSDVDANMAAERAVARQRGLPALLEDRGATLASALEVEFTTHAVVLDRSARVLYSGGIDSDRTHLSSAAQGRWLEDALQAALTGRPVAKPKTEPLGCPLKTR